MTLFPELNCIDANYIVIYNLNSFLLLTVLFEIMKIEKVISLNIKKLEQRNAWNIRNIDEILLSRSHDDWNLSIIALQKYA